MTGQQVNAETKEKLLGALRLLVGGRGDVSVRLDLAIPRLHSLKESDFPHDLQKDYRELRTMLDERARKLSGRHIEVQDAALRILELYRRIMER
jgi:hypothetical protein